MIDTGSYDARKTVKASDEDKERVFSNFKKRLKAEAMTRIKLNCIHADTCLPDYWRGHHAAHIQVPVTRDTTMTELRRALHDELKQGAVMGSDERTRDDSGEVGDAWYKAAHAAVNRDVKLVKGAKRPFGDLEEFSEDAEDSVYAFFVFTDIEPEAP